MANSRGKNGNFNDQRHIRCTRKCNQNFCVYWSVAVLVEAVYGDAEAHLANTKNL